MRTRSSLFGLLLLGSAHGQFGAFQEFAPDGNRPWCVRAADLDGDGDMDVVAAFAIDGLVAWYENDGSGTFTGPLVINANAQYAKFVVVADLDGDGDTDVVTGRGSPAVFEWHANDGAGNFGPGQVIRSAGGGSYALVVADMDGDGDLDVATSAQVGGLHWHANEGGGTAWTGHAVDTLSNIADIELADLDGDGDLDMLLAASGNAVVHWRENEGAGVYGTEQIISSGSASGIDVAAADMDGDGDLDIGYITNWTNGLGWYENLGGGVFGIANVLSTTLSLPTWLEMDDVDQDGLPDILVTVKWSRRVEYHRNLGAGAFAPALVLTDQANGAFCVAVADLDGDSDLDVLFCSEEDNKIGWCAQLAPNVFSAPVLVIWSVDGPSDIQLVDLDGDGDLDPVAASWTDGSLVWFPNDGSGALADPVLLARDHSAPAPMVFSDLDGDGDVDIALGFYNGTVGWYANVGNGQFDPLQVISTADTTVWSIAVADLNGDGGADLITASQIAPGNITWFASTGPGTFGPPQSIETGVGFRTVACADLDGDGDQDVVATRLPDQLSWYANDGAGSFAPPVTIATDLHQAYQLGLHDLDGDLDMDIVVVRQPVIVYDGGAPVDTLPRVVWYANDGNGNFSPEQLIADHPGSARMLVCDLDADGDLDVLLAISNGTVLCHLNDGIGGFGTAFQLPPTPEAVTALGSGDVDGDGDPEVFTASSTYDRLGWYENYFGSPYRIAGRVFLDLDGDGSFTPGDTSGAYLSVNTAPYLSTVVTDPQGNYVFYLAEGTYDVSAVSPGPLWELSTGSASYNVALTVPSPLSIGNDFGFAPVVDTTVLEPMITVGAGPCGGSIQAWLHVRNAGTRTEQGILTFAPDPAYVFLQAVPAPDSTAGGVYYWSFEQLPIFGELQIAVFLQQPGVGFMGNTLSSAFTVDRTDGTGVVTDTFSAEATAVLACAYDPNDKLVLPVGYGALGALPLGTERLTYTVRFQNTGTAEAYSVMIRDQLDAGLDLNSFLVQGASHQLTEVCVEQDGEAVFTFQDIMLPDSAADPLGSQGYVKFHINIASSAQHLTAIQNTASIFFDFNPPIVTNTTVTTLVDCALWQPEIVSPAGNVLEATAGDRYQWYFDGTAIPGATTQWLLDPSVGTYTVEVTSVYGCVSMSNAYQWVTTVIAAYEGLRIAIVPNPSRSSPRLLLGAPLGEQDRILVMDVNGRVHRELRASGLQEIEIDRGVLAAGLYIVRVLRDGDQLGAVRMVLQ
jgi:uncharacterized repeat protein (TIGR01451 family)